MDSAPEFEERRDALIAEITAAFDGVSRKDGTTLHEADAMDDWKSPDEQRAARRLDLERRWQDVPDSDIFACSSALSFLCEKGFRYYLAAFMVCGLKNWDRDWEEDPHGIIHTCQYHLLHDYPKSLRESDPASISDKYMFDAAQRRAVAKFLRFIIDSDPSVADEATVQAVEKWERFIRLSEMPLS